MRRVTALVVLLLTVGIAVGYVATHASGQGRERPRSPGSWPTLPQASTPPAAPTAASDAKCPAAVDRPFVPLDIQVPGTRGRTSVIQPPRDAAGIPGIPPLTSAGKVVFAWDREQGIRPGDGEGNVLLNAHTWPDGSALGNKLLQRLHRGDRIVVHGKGRVLCYRVTERIEVAADQGLARYYDTAGPPQLAIVVCSGRRLGPGSWEDRTIWFASPSS